MLDRTVRARLNPRLSAIGERLAAIGVKPNQLTALGFVVGAAACVSIALDHWEAGLVLWLLNRVVDGLDGAVARATHTTELGGFLDIMADFSVYGGMLVALGIAEPDLRLAALVTFLAYYLSGSAFLAWSSLAERHGLDDSDDGRSLRFPAGLAEGTETIAAMTLVLVFRDAAETILWIWCGVVGTTVIQRVMFVRGRLDGRPDQASTRSAP